MDRTAKGVIVGNAVIWAAVLFGTAVVLHGTGYFGQLLPLLAGGAGASVVTVGGGVRRVSR